MCDLYRHFNSDGVLLYVGISLSSVYRLSQHRDVSPWYDEISRVDIEKFSCREDALHAERHAIIKEAPLYNKTFQCRGGYLGGRTSTPAVEDSKRKLIATYDPTYSVRGAADTLGIGETAMKRLIDSGDIGHITIENGSRIKILITGWQLIEFLEHKQKAA
jgi:hypothetical protein